MRRVITDEQRSSQRRASCAKRMRTVTEPLNELREALREAGPDAAATVLFASLSEARAASVKLWRERHAEAMGETFYPEVMSALKQLAASRAVEEARWASPDSALFTPTHNPAWLRGYAGRTELEAVDGNCVTFPLCTYEAELPQGSTLPPARDDDQNLVADDEACIAFDPKAHERLVSVLPVTLRFPLHADGSVFDTLLPPAGAWEPRPAGVIDSDETLEAQDAVWAGRAARGALSEAAMHRRRVARFGEELPAPAFFEECVRVQTPEDVPGIVARHRAMEEAARDELAAQVLP